MKVKTYLRVANGGRGYRVEASTKPNYKPLTKGKGTFYEEPIPTAAFALILDIPEDFFQRAEKVLAEVTVEDSAAHIAAEVEA